MKFLTTSIAPDSFVKLRITFWDVCLDSLEVAFLPCPVTGEGYSSWTKVVKDSLVRNNYDIIGIIKTVDKDNLFAMLLIARKKLPSEESE